MTTLTFAVKDMHCVNCAMRLQELEDILPGVVSVDASYTRQKIVVKFDGEKTNETQIISAVKDLGYTAEIVK